MFAAPLRTSLFFLLLVFLMLLLLPRAQAASNEPAQNGVQTGMKADLAGQANPAGIMVQWELYRRWTGMMDLEHDAPRNYLQTGIGIGTTPAYGRLNVNFEWQPVIFANLRFQYDIYRYYGVNTALLSFPSGESPFGEREVDAMKGQEAAGFGNRFLVRPTIYAKFGKVLIMNRTDFAYFHFPGQGPYFLEWTYETLLTNGDHVLENRSDVLVEAWKGPGKAQFLLGPYYETLHASSSSLKRNRAGVVMYWVPANSLGPLKRPRIYGQAGIYLHDRNRDGEAYAALGAGFDF